MLYRKEKSMYLSKVTGKIRKHTKAITCAVLAVCILAAAFVTVPLGTSADEKKENTLDAIFVGKIGADNCAGAFIPVDIANGDANLYSGVTYFKLEFKCRMLSGTKPVIGVMRVDSAENTAKTYSEPSWCNNASDVTVENGICTAYFKVDFKNRINYNSCGWRSFYITVGNAEHDDAGVSEKDNTVSFIMSEATLVTCDAGKNVIDETNRLPEFTAENIDFGGIYYTRSNGCSQWDCPASAISMKWHMDSNSFAVKHITVPDNYYNASDYDAANFILHEATDNVREYYTNNKYEGMYFEKLANSNDKGFAVISDDLNKKFVFIDANRNGEADDTTSDSYAPQKNKAGNIFLPLSLGQYSMTGSSTSNSKVLLKVTFTANRIEGDGPPVLGRVVAKPNNGTGCWAWGLSTMNARPSGYYTNYDRSDNGGGIRPQCTYDPKTGEFVGWVGMDLANSELLTRWGTSEVLTIGNAEHVYQTGVFDSTSFNSAFSIYGIKVDLYSTNQSGNTFTPDVLIAEDIAPRLTADNIDADGEWFFDYKNGVSNHEKDLIRASQNMWHIDGEKSLVSFINMEDIAEYSTKYSLEESGSTGVLSAYVTLKPGKTYQYIFKSKYQSDKKAKPFVEFVTVGGAKKLDCSNYISDKGDYYNTVFAFKTPSTLTGNKNVRIGIDFASAEINGTFGGFELFEIGEDGMALTGKNLMGKVFISEGDTIEAFSANAEEGVWTKEGSLGSGDSVFNIVLRENAFYKKPAEPQMIIFAGSVSKSEDPEVEFIPGNGILKQSATIKKNTKYRFSADIKYCSEGFNGEKFGLSFYTYNQLGREKELTTLTKIEDPNRYNETYEFTAPSALSAKSNFSVTLNIPNAYVSGYFANVSLYQIDESGNAVGENLILNGDFSTGDVTGWIKTGSYGYFRFCDIPDNFFNKNPGHNIHSLQYRDTADFLLLQQMLQIKPDTYYQVEYTSLITGLTNSEPYGVLYQKIWENEAHTESSWSYMLDDEKNVDVADPVVTTKKRVLNRIALGELFDSSDPKGQAIRVTKTFKTSENLRLDSDNNLSVRFYFMAGSSGYVSDFKVYEVEVDRSKVNITFKDVFISNLKEGEHSITVIGKDGKVKQSGKFTVKNSDTGVFTANLNFADFERIEVDGEEVESDKYYAEPIYTRVGSNVILDGDFSSGDEVFDNKTQWKYANEGNIRNIELQKGFFENYTLPKKILRSDGSFANETYGNRLSVDPKSRYYFSGNYVKTNFVGINPQVFYKSVSANGQYVSIPVDLYFDTGKYYFETQGGFIIPDDAVINADGKADIIVQVNNLDHGKGYFCNLTLTENNSSRNLFDDSKADVGKFKVIDYDPEIFRPFEGDEKFEDIGWAGQTDNIITGELTGKVYDSDGFMLSGVKMLLMPGNISVTTNDSGAYNFENMKPGNYTLYLVESSGYRLYCCEVNIEAGMLTTLPDIYYSSGKDDSLDIDEPGEIEIDDNTGVKKEKYGILQGYCYSPEGKLLSGIDIYANTKKLHAKTNEKGMFEFEKLAPGEYKICTLLEDGSTYVFKTVKIEAGKKLTIKVMMPKEEQFPMWALIAIIAGGVVLLAAIALLVILLILRKKKKAAVLPAQTGETPQEVS